MTSYCFQSDSSGCHSVKVPRTTVVVAMVTDLRCHSKGALDTVIVAMVTDLCPHLSYDSRGAWHTVYAMLPSHYK